ncbi:MAG: SOS response-associated peptidase [Methanomicrobiales archaeon]|nr:SOS response-associated peptidase [Methanomicrobiales archaeon]
MCGRFSIAVRIGYLAERFGVHEPPGISLPRFNIAPGEEVPVITGNERAQVVMMHWGLIPSRIRGEKPAQAPVNARAEALNENKLFRPLLLHGRCVVPATGFYEWKKSGNQKSPYYFRMKTQEIFSMAGLCNSREAPDGRMVWSFTIITTGPNSLVTPIHNRMPAILIREDEKKWLCPDCDISEGLATMLNPYPPENMMAYRVTKMVNKPSFKSKATVQEENPGATNDLFAWDTR